MKINIFGSEWNVITLPSNDTTFTEDCGGYCDQSSKTICLRDYTVEELVGIRDIEALKKYVLRHELIHAALLECGLGDNWVRNPTGHDETGVDWLAHKMPQLISILNEAEAL